LLSVNLSFSPNPDLKFSIEASLLQIIRTFTPKKLAFDSNSYLYWHQFLNNNSGGLKCTYVSAKE
jgi:hypothetical protein